MALVLGTNSFITVQEADDYFLDNLQLDQWIGVLDQKKSQALITAGTQINQIIISSCALPQSTIKTSLKNANAELALAMILKPALVLQGSTSKNIKKIKADTVDITFFRASNGVRFPSIVMNLLKEDGCYKGSSGVGVIGVGGAEVSGICEPVAINYDKSTGYA